MQKQWTITVAACGVGVLGLALAATAVAVQDDVSLFQQRTSGLLVHIAERRLNLTDAQRGQIRTILKTEQPTIQTLAMRVHQEQQELLAQPEFNEAFVRSYAQQHEATLEDVLVEREKVRQAMLAVLTPEQRARARQLRASMFERFYDRLPMLGDEI